MFPLNKRQLECIHGESEFIPWTHCVISGLPPVDSLLYILTRCNLVEPLKWSDRGGAMSHSRTPEGSEFIFASRLVLLPLEYFHQTSPECVHSVVCRHNTSAASCLDLLAVEIVVGHRSETSPHQSSKPNLFCHPADKYAHTFTHACVQTLSEQREVGLKLWQTVQPKLRLSMESFSFFSSPVPSFDATFVINSDKSSGSSPLMCARHITRTHKHTSRIHHPQ